MDGKGNRLFKRNMNSYFRKELNSKSTKILDNFKLVDSKNNILIQLSDMIAGSIRRSYDKSKLDHLEYRSLFKTRIIDCKEVN